jgi:hypothetical protein
MGYDYMGYYDVVNGHPPLHDHRGHVINNHPGVALDVPAQLQVAPPVPVCTEPTFVLHTHT